MSNLCRGSPVPKYIDVQSAIPVLCHYLHSDKISDKHIIADCMWAVSCHLDTRDKKQVVIDSGLVPDLLTLLKKEKQ